MADEPDPSTLALERKLATILSADVAEFSRLMAEDEEQTLRIFRGHRQIFESLVALHRGRVFNTAGDAILAEFASAVEAVRCATEIQAALRTRNDQLPPERQVRFRIGVNLGDVMVQNTDLLGDGVNVAARLQAAAEPGGGGWPRLRPARPGGNRGHPQETRADFLPPPQCLPGLLDVHDAAYARSAGREPQGPNQHFLQPEFLPSGEP